MLDMSKDISLSSLYNVALVMMMLVVHAHSLHLVTGHNLTLPSSMNSVGLKFQTFDTV